MTASISGKTDHIDWTAIAAALAPVKTIAEPVLVKKRSRDFFWYSPILNAALKKSFGDLVALPASVDEMADVLSIAFTHNLPLVLRGGGTGNYGQSVPVDGGLIIETTGMNRVLDIGEGWVRVEAGAFMSAVNDKLAASGQELAMFPSTKDIATVGGFVAGGSAGIGSLANGALREPGNIIALTVMSVEETPQIHRFEGADVLQIHHAWGLNGVILDVTLRTVPTQDWIGCMATFDSYDAAYAAGYAVAQAGDIGAKLVSTVDARITDYFPRLEGHIRSGHDLLVTLIPRADVPVFEALIAKQGGYVDLVVDDTERARLKLPHIFDFSYNHTTLQVLKADRSATYQQYGCPQPPDAARVADLRDKLGDDVWNHHEFSRYLGEITSADLPIIWYSTPERLAEINSIYETNGFPVYDAHTWQVEGGGMKPDFGHLAWKKRLDPKGLLNSAKSRAWSEVKHLSPEAIDAKSSS